MWWPSKTDADKYRRLGPSLRRKVGGVCRILNYKYTADHPWWFVCKEALLLVANLCGINIGGVCIIFSYKYRYQLWCLKENVKKSSKRKNNPNINRKQHTPKNPSFIYLNKCQKWKLYLIQYMVVDSFLSFVSLLFQLGHRPATRKQPATGMNKTLPEWQQPPVWSSSPERESHL